MVELNLQVSNARYLLGMPSVIMEINLIGLLLRATGFEVGLSDSINITIYHDS